MTNKTCFICNVEKSLDEFYKHPKMGDGHLNKCKTCTKMHTMQRYKRKSSDSEWLNSERKRNREKYFRLGYRDKHRPSLEDRKKFVESYYNKFPEKRLTRSRTQHFKRGENNELHHWSYNEIHYKDVIELGRSDHAKVHRFLMYDPATFFYFRKDTMELLNTRALHESYIEYVLREED